MVQITILKFFGTHVTVSDVGSTKMPHIWEVAWRRMVYLNMDIVIPLGIL